MAEAALVGHVPEPAPRRRRPEPVSRLVPRYLVFQALCQVALLVEAIAPLRVWVRLAAFGASLVLLVLVRRHGRRRRPHPARPAAFMALFVTVAALFHPDTPPLAGLAQVGLYTSVLAPLFWVPRLHLDLRVLRDAALVLWLFHSASATLGVLQVWMPGQFQPAVSQVVIAKGRSYMETLKITTATGQRVFRPMGLSDVPGGAGASGFYAVLFGMGFFLTARTRTATTLSLASVAIGMTCLYLAQVRALVVTCAICIAGVTAVLAWRREGRKLAALGSMIAVSGSAGLLVATSLAGAAVTRRLDSLTRAAPGTVYYANRGHFLEEAFAELLPRYPFGAGVGRWGMMASYFGDPGRATFWVEIQWAAWILDGGVPLLLAYCAALIVTPLTTWRVARRHRGEARFWAVIVLAYSVGALAMTFSYPLFASQMGAEFWLLNATLFAATRRKSPAVA